MGSGEYVRAKGNIARANAEIVERARARPRAELMAAAEPWATRPPLTTRSAAVFLLGDTAIHHQDILRGAGRSRDVPAPCAGGHPAGGRRARARTACSATGWCPTTAVDPWVGARWCGARSEALGLWLAGRTTVESDLVFVQ